MLQTRNDIEELRERERAEHTKPAQRRVEAPSRSACSPAGGRGGWGVCVCGGGGGGEYLQPSAE